MKHPLRTLLKRHDTGRIYRIVWSSDGRTWLMPVGDRTGEWPFAESDDAIAQSGYVQVSEAESGLPAPRADSDAWKDAQKTEERFNLTDLTAYPFLTDRGRVQALHERAPDAPSKFKSTFYRVIRRWLEGGCTTESLLPRKPAARQRINTQDLDKISYRSAFAAVRSQSRRLLSEEAPELNLDDHTASGKPRIRPNISAPSLFKVDRNTLRVFRAHYRAKHLAKGESLRHTYDRLRRHCFASRSPTGDLLLWPLWVIPSYYVFEDWYYHLTGQKERRTAAVGAHGFDLNERPIESQQTTKPFGAGLVGQIDATVWNVTLVSSGKGARPIGPPIVFRVRCEDTGRLLGLSVTLESASWEGAASAIANCLEDKLRICTDLGIQSLRPEDFVQALPSKIDADCGETDNHRPNRFIRRTGIRIRNVPYARPDLKGGIESDFNTLQCGINGLTPSAIIKQHEETTGRPWKMKGTMTLEDFLKILWLEELKRLNRPRPDLRLPEEMINDGVDTSPASMWDWMLKNKPTFIQSFPLEEVRLSLLQTGEGTIDARGLVFKDIIYGSEHITPDQRAAARRSGSKKVRVAFDSRLVDTVHLMVGDENAPSQYLQCQLKTNWLSQRSFVGKTFREVNSIKVDSDRINMAATEAAAPRIHTWSEQQEAIVAASKLRTENERRLEPASAAAMERGIPAARLTEKNITSPSQALVPIIEASVPAAQSLENAEGSPEESSHREDAQPQRRKSRFAARAHATLTTTTES